MALPGLQLSVPVVTTAPPAVHRLQRGSEWRFEVAFGSRIEVRVTSGTAEMFGTELAPNQVYRFSGTKAAIYTWHGCQLEVAGQCQVEYIAEETLMVSYANVHFALERLRREATLNGKEGPNVVVVGPDHAGKTSLVKILTGYATKTGREPLVVNLDPREGLLSVPGCLTAVSFSSIIDVEEGWGSGPTSGPSPVPAKLPLAYYYGLPSPEDHRRMFKPVVSRLAVTVTSKLAEDEGAKVAGCIIDTAGIISQGNANYDIIHHVVSEYSVNVILVLGSERLYSDMVRRFHGSKSSTEESISVVKLAKSGGCVDRDQGYMTQFRQMQIREYFFGPVKRTLSPTSQLAQFGQISIFKIHEANEILASLMPGGGGGGPDDGDEAPIFDRVEPSSLMQNCLLAVMHARPSYGHEAIRDASVMGFVYVADVDETKRQLRFLSPVAGALSDHALIWGRWPEPAFDLV